MDTFTTDRITEILVTAGAADSPLDRLIPLVYEELREIAHRQLHQEHACATLSTTVLVHEAYLKLAADARVADRGRAYFFAAGAQAMRRIVVDHARRRRRLKRGAGVPVLVLDETVADGSDPVDVLDLERGLERLSQLAARATHVVECRYYGGLTVEDTALALGVTTRTVKRDWAFARAWLFDFLNGDNSVEEDV